MDRKTKIIVLFFCILKLALHLAADYNSGFQGDELLHIETGRHLAFGYMEFPPLIGMLAYIQNLFHSQSVFVHHIFAHIATVLTLVYTSKITIELGGKAKAVFLVLFCILIVPGFGRSQQLFQPVVFSQLLWVLSFYQLTRYVKYLDPRYLWYLTLTVAVAFLTKYDALFFIFGLGSLLFFKNTRQALVKHKFWWNILVFFALISPNLLWQLLNNFPVLKMFARLHETQLDKLAPFEILEGLIVSLNPLALLLSVPAIVGIFYQKMKLYRPLAFSIFLSVLFLAYSRGKGYYFYPVFLTIFPFGGVFWEKLLSDKKKWLLYPIACLLSVGVLLIPFGMPIYSLERYLNDLYPYEEKNVGGGKYAIRFEERYSVKKWNETLAGLKMVLYSLPEKEQEECLIWGKHYGQAGAVALLGERYGLPRPFSLHGSFYTWLPSGKMPHTTIAIRYGKAEGKDFFEPYFEEVRPVKAIYNPYADDEEKLWQTIFVCKNPRQDFQEIKKLFAERIYE
ncbi:glycosyltransferase family 39 protein [Olivibacter sp. XZL3]|uniref:ArnT family glycosyltransferase n=1 Tax=Olivibacter sp. XZL3 TaxID=1735116 RepID=UPI0010657C6D|nr:glycosyltransferase family 39 protein [Olivibacter sp. XZL3]